MSQPKILPPGLRDQLRRVITNPLFQDRVEFVKYSAETGGTLTQVRITLGPGGGNPVHYHTTFEETFIPEKGRLGVFLGKRELILSPGETATVPLRTNHRFFNPSDTEEIVFSGRTNPGLENFEQGLYIVYGLARDGLTDKEGIPTSIVHLALFVTMSNTLLPGWGFWFMRPFFAALYWYAIWSGEKERLVNKYWG